MTTTAFNTALNFVLQWEGGYSNHPNDKGGETNFGITYAVYNQYRLSKRLPKQSVKFISQLEVADIYYSNNWLRANCDLLPAKLALCHFDWSVNHGVIGANKTLQQVVNATPDGIIGLESKKAIEIALSARGEISLVSNYCAIREHCYRRWGVGSQAVFLKGWLNRLAAVKKVVA